MLLLSSIQVLLLGSLYTLSRKYQNLQLSEGLNGKISLFHHPLYQTFWLFFGMALLLPLLFFTKKIKDPEKKDVKVSVLMFPAFCDVCGTIVDSTGLIYTHVSVHQMLKGFIVIFTAMISYLLFKRKFTKIQFLGIFSVILGLTLVGLCNIHSYNSKFAPRPILGNCLVILAQFFLAGMFVYEEKILKEYDVHVLEVVGWEGIWGMLLSAAFLGLFFLIPGRDFGSLENPIQATLQVMNNYTLLGAILCSSLVIGPFNYFGTNLTKHSSSMHRCLIDASRMCVVWIISICCGWEHFKFQQTAGYLFVMLGNLIYYEIINFESCFPQETEEQKTHSSPIPLPDTENCIKKVQTVNNDNLDRGFYSKLKNWVFKNRKNSTLPSSEEQEKII